MLALRLVALRMIAPAIFAVILAIRAVMLLLMLELLLPLGHFTLCFTQHPGVMLGMLKEALLCHAIIGKLGIARQHQIFVDDLLRRATNLTLRAGAVEDAVDDIPQRALAIGFIART